MTPMFWRGVVVGVLLAAISGPRLTRAQDDQGVADWGPESNGLRCRVVAISSQTDDEKPDLTATVDSFATGDDVTLGVELKNGGEKPLTLLGVRYGDSYPTAKGRLNTESMAPHLFALELTDATGKPITRPEREFIDSSMHVDSTSMHELAPGGSLIIALRPTKFQYDMAYRFPPGAYQVRVRYRGLEERVRKRLEERTAERPQAAAWSGDAASKTVAFTVEGGPAEPDEPPWGEPVKGLRAAVVLKPRANAVAPDELLDFVPLGSAVDAKLLFQNVSEAPISLSSETWRQDDQVTVTNDAGQSRDIRGTWYTGWPVVIRWTLQPGEMAEVSAVGLAVVANDEDAKKFEHPVGRMFNAVRGRYTVHYTIHLGRMQMKDGKGNVLVPLRNDWTGTLTTGEARLGVRARTPKDDARVAAQNFTGRVEFVGEDGSPVTSGAFTVRSAAQQGQPAPIAIHAGPIEIPDCRPGEVSVQVRAAGYEETQVLHATLPRDATKQFRLKPAAPARFRLVTADGQPVAGAKVRYFVKNSEGAAGGPLPEGVEGPVWAESRDDGRVVLDMLQKVNPLYADLGDAVYFFYVEPPTTELAPTFVGPVKAGADLGDVALGPLLTVRGEVRGTAEELTRFAAEWDQPYEVKTQGRAKPYVYAVSQRLETQREGDKLTFMLQGLRPGMLRIVCNFGPRPHAVSHTYGRRDPQGSDVVVGVEVKESVDDLVLSPSGRE